MGKMEVPCLVEGGKASGGPPLGPAIGPTGIPIKSVVDMINNKTKEFKGLKVPVVVILDTDAKTFEVKVKTPMCSALLFKEAGVEKGTGKPGSEVTVDIPFDTVIRVTKMKRDSLNALSLKTAVKIVVGTCQSAGIKIDGKAPKQVQKDIEAGVYDEPLKE